MRARPLLLAVLLLAVPQLGGLCSGSPHIQILAPASHSVGSFSFAVEFRVVGAVDPASLEVELNHTSILDRVTGGPEVFQAWIEPGPPLRDHNLLKVSARRASGHGRVVAAQPFAYLPPGKAHARRIRDDDDRIRGPLGHSRVGDWLLENGVARFAVQDAPQRELYSVGQYGGNLIDAELVGHPGMDNFLELQPGLNIESVVDAQTVEIVNDGEDGTAAVVRSCGPDDTLDFVNPSSQVTDLGLPFPALADDQDLEIEACTSYSLAPEKTFVRVDTEVFNEQTLGSQPPGAPADGSLPLFVGDWLNPAGELDTVARPTGPQVGFNLAANGVGPATASTLGTLGFVGYDQASGVDYAFTTVPLAPPLASANGTFVFISGVLVILHSQNALLALLGADPVRFVVPLGESRTFTRFFGVGDGSGATAYALENEVKGLSEGTLEGCVRVAGAPAAGARISVGLPLGTHLPATSLGSDKLVAHFVSREGACPNYSGSVQAGSYEAAAGLTGHLYEGGAASPPLHDVTVPAGGVASVDFDLPAAGRLHVDVRDEANHPVPARVTVVGFDPSPEIQSVGPSLPGFGGDDLGLLNDVSDAEPFGIAAVGYADATGTAEITLEPGVSRYHVYVSRGTEYSAWRTASPITIAAGSTTALAARIARVVDTPGFVSSDFHVHGIRSADSRVSDIHRVESYTAEGVENVIMTDHHVHTNLRPTIAAAGMADFVTATVGEEITTFDYGHFNAYPLKLDPNSPHATYAPDGTQLSGGSTDWAQAEPPGRDFRIPWGALNATPAGILALATGGALSIPGVTTAQINHISSHFQPLKIDTSLVPPRDLMSDLDRARRRLPSTAAVPNLFQDFPALELWNGDTRGNQSEFLDQRIGIWMNLLNQGRRTTFIADTDSHTFRNLKTAGARTWTASPTDLPAAIDPADVADSVVAGRAVGGQGVYVQTRLRATDGSQADLTWGGHTDVSDPAGDVVLDIDVQSPAWAEWDTVEIYANAGTFTAGSPYLFGATPSLVLHEGDCDPATSGDGDFDVAVTHDVGGVPGADRWSASLSVPFHGLAEQTWFVVVVKGGDGVCAPMFPMYPANLASASNASLADLVDGNVGEGGVMALGATNALTFEP